MTDDDSTRTSLRPTVAARLQAAALGAGLLGAVLLGAGAADSASAAAPPAGDTGGAGFTSTVPGGASVTPVGGPDTTTSGVITLQSPQIALLRGDVSFTGTVADAQPGETVTVQRQTATPGVWVTAATGPVGPTGTFVATWRANRSGSLSIRAVLNATVSTAERQATRPAGRRRVAVVPPVVVAATPALTLTVYKSAIATFFGPGIFGRQTACGQRLTRQTVGVASRTLPCGTLVAIYYHGQQLVVPVVDRGPYSPDATWDLTLATAKALGITETVRIGALSPPPAA